MPDFATNLPNEAIFFAQALVALSAVLVAARLGAAWLTGLICAMIVLMNLFVLKQMRLFGMDVTGGNVLYAAVFLSTDLLAEHWGRRRAYRAVWAGFFVSVFFVAMSCCMLLTKPNAYDWASEPLAALLEPQWRIVGASMLTYLVVQHLDVWQYDFYKRKTKGRMLWLRNNASTWVSQLVDSTLFTILAFAATGYPILQMIVFTYVIKILVAALDTPFIYLSKTPLLRPRVEAES